MTDTEKRVLARLCVEIVAETELYITDTEVRNLVDWVCLSEQMKANNNEIRILTGEYKRIEPQCQEGIKECLEQMKSISKERNRLYEKQNELRGQMHIT